MWLSKSPALSRGAGESHGCPLVTHSRKGLLISESVLQKWKPTTSRKLLQGLSVPNMPRWGLFMEFGREDPSTWNIHPPSLPMTDSLSSFSWDFTSIEKPSQQWSHLLPCLSLWRCGLTYVHAFTICPTCSHTPSAKPSKDRSFVYLVHCFNPNVWDSVWHDVVHSKI